MPRLFYFAIAIIEFISYLMIDPFHTMKGWASMDEGKKGRMLILHKTGIVLMIVAAVVALVPALFHHLTA